jgi:hypothetical protein
MMSLSAVGVPVFLDTNTDTTHLLRQWARLYHYGHIMMPALAVGATTLYAYTALSKRAANNKQWPTYAKAAATTISIVPFTWIVMTSTNNTLFGLLDAANAKASTVEMGSLRGLIVRWSFLHLARSFFPLCGAVMGLKGLLHELGL